MLDDLSGLALLKLAIDAKYKVSEDRSFNVLFFFWGGGGRFAAVLSETRNLSLEHKVIIDHCGASDGTSLSNVRLCLFSG